jgi:polar amino acid transport system substrate-binding protein
MELLRAVTAGFVHRRTILLSLAAFGVAVLFVTGILLAVSGSAVLGQDADTAVKEDGAQEEPRRVVVRFLTEGDFPPFNYYDDEGVLAGFNVDLARAICLDIGAACDIKVRPWEELFLGLKRGDADAVIAGHSVSSQALAEVDFTDRYFHTPGRFAGRTGGSKLEISPDGLDGATIGVAKGTAHEAYLRTYFRDSKILTFENPELAREALQQSKVDVLFEDAISLAFWLNGSLARQCCEFKGGPYFEPKFFGDGIAIAVPRNDPQIRTLINAALKRVRQSGRFQELVERYFPLRIY